MKIKEVMECTGLTDRAIRLYITSDLIRPTCTESYNGRKNFEFGEADVEALQKIALLRKADFSIEQIRVLQKGGYEAGEMLRRFLDQKRKETERGQRVLDALESLGEDKDVTLDAVCERITGSFDSETLPTEDSSPYGRSLECPFCHTVFGGSPWCPNCKQTPFPMKWYAFLIYFWLFFSAAAYLYQGLDFLAISTDQLFNGEAMDAEGITVFVYAFLFSGLAVLAVVTRFRLSGYKMNAPTLITVYFVLEGVINLTWNWAAFIVTEGWDGDFGVMTGLFFAVLTVLNYLYFNRRVEMFVY